MSKALIVGLRRSGTTAFWQWFRADSRWRCFDEPFSEQLLRLPQDHEKTVWREFIDLHHQDPARFWDHYAPLHRAEELRDDLTDRQTRYLEWLLGQHDRVIVDTTRCHLKLRHLAEHTSADSVVHLHRSRRGFVTSHLLPNRSDPIGRMRKEVRKRSFFTRVNDYDGWGMQMLIGSGPGSPLSVLLDEVGYRSPLLYDLPAAGRLMVLWDFFCRQAEESAKRHFPNRVASVRFEDFTASPGTVASQIAETLGHAKPPGISRPEIRPAAVPFADDDERWATIERQAARCLPNGTWWDEL